MNSRNRKTATSMSNWIFLCSCLEGQRAGLTPAIWEQPAWMPGCGSYPSPESQGNPTTMYPLTSATQVPQINVLHGVNPNISSQKWSPFHTSKFLPGISQFSSVSQSCPTLRPHGLQHSRPPCPSPTPGAYSNSRPLSGWCHPNISPCHPLLLPPSIFPSIRVFSNESVLCIRWPKYWSFSFSISPSNEYSGLISFRIDWLYCLAVQGTLKSLLLYHSSKALILRHSAFFIFQLLHPHMTSGKTIALTRWTFVGKVTSLLFNMLSRLVITFFPRSKRL